MSNKRGKGSSATYWRRRFIALVAGLAIFGVMAWSVSGALGKPKIINPAANVVSGKHHPAGGSGAAAGATATSTPAPAPAASPDPAPDLAPGTTPASPPAGGTAGNPVTKQPARHPASPVGTASGAPGNSGGGPGHAVARICSAGHVVLTVVASRTSYAAHADPQFTVDVVATGRQTCTFNVGATHLTLLIRTAAGRVWNSADCAAGRKSLPTDLVPGVPTALPISWNRTTSSPGCKVAASKVPAGVYAATASNGSITSNKEIFRIR